MVRHEIDSALSPMFSFAQDLKPSFTMVPFSNHIINRPIISGLKNLEDCSIAAKKYRNVSAQI